MSRTANNLYRCMWLMAGALACGASPGETTGESSGGSGSGGSSEAGVTDGGSDSGGEEIDPAIAACLRINACEADGGAPIGMHACLGHVLDRRWSWATVGPQRVTLAALDCKLAATDCAGVRACTPAPDDFAAACAGVPGGDLCQGDTWVFCDELGAPVAALDCAAMQLGCHQDIWAGCGAEPCEFGVTQPSCDGDVLIECDPAGWMVRVDCAEQYNLVHVSGKDSEQVYSIAGETCGHDPMRGALGCVGTGDVCDFFSQRCDGDVLETCAGGQLARRDCGAMTPTGQGCGFIQSGQFAGAAACGLLGGACDLGADESCEAGVLGFCDLGAPAQLDCAAAGYAGCETAMLGERRVGFCTP